MRSCEGLLGAGEIGTRLRGCYEEEGEDDEEGLVVPNF